MKPHTKKIDPDDREDIEKHVGRMESEGGPAIPDELFDNPEEGDKDEERE